MNGYLREWRRERMARCVSKAGRVHAVDEGKPICGAVFVEEEADDGPWGFHLVRVTPYTARTRDISCVKCVALLDSRATAHVTTGTGWA